MIAKDQCPNILERDQESNLLWAFLKQHYPEVIKDKQIDFLALKQILGIAKEMPSYGLVFPGKDLANALYSTPTHQVLKSIDSSHAHNFILVGDNLDALKLLKNAYYEQIKMIYIDPPYNTQNENFIYPDNFYLNDAQILKACGWMGVDGQQEASEKLHFFKNLTGARSHSAWLAFMLPRLKLARDLLKSDGVIFISIDDHEQANLKLLCDEIFGEENFVANLVWQHRQSGQNDIDITVSHNYTLTYAKDRTIFKFNRLEPNLEKFSNPDNDLRGAWVADPFDAPNIRENLSYTITNPNTGEVFYPPHGRCWRMSKEKFEEALKDNRIVFGKSGKSKPQYKRFKFEAEQKGENINTIWLDCGTATSGTKEIQALFGSKVFDTPKPTKLIQKLLQIATTPAGGGGEPDIILDFFAGSGTTAHALMAQNLADGGQRQFILVQQREPISEKKHPSAYAFCKDTLKSLKPNISDITIERVRRAKEKLQSPMDVKVYHLMDKSSPHLFEELPGLEEDSLKPMDQARNLALKLGKPLALPIQEHIRGQLYRCADDILVLEGGEEMLERLELLVHPPHCPALRVCLDGYTHMDLRTFTQLKFMLAQQLVVVY